MKRVYKLIIALILLGLCVEGVQATLSGNFVPKMTSDTTPSPNFTYASSYHPVYRAYQAFNHDYSSGDGWLSGGSNSTGELIIKTSEPHGLMMYTIYGVTYAGGQARAPNTWTVRGSMNGTEWSGDLDYHTDVTWSSSIVDNKSYNLTITSQYTYYKFTVTENNGDANLAIHEILMYDAAINPPVSNFTISNNTGIAPLITNFTDTSTNTPTSWNYTAYSITNSTEFLLSYDQNPTITFPYIGNYSVMLNTSSTAGYNKTPLYTKWVNVSPPSPVAAFSGYPTSGLFPLTVNFTDASTNTPTSWLWDFGDGDNTNSTEQNPIHTYNSAGPFSVNLTATNEYGSDYEYKADYLTVYYPITSSFSVVNAAGTAPHTTYLYDTSTNLTPGPVTYSWDFGEGNTSTEEYLYFTWNATGEYNVTHTVSNGLSSSTSFTNVTVGTPTPPVVAPVASFYGSPTTGNVPLTTSFTDVSSNTPTSWFWEFGDGTNSTSQNPTHQYNRSGFRTVNLTATNSAGSNVTTRLKFVKVS